MSVAPEAASPGAAPATPRPAGSGDQEMLTLPDRGDLPARRWVAVGIVLYFGLVGVFLFGLIDWEAGIVPSLAAVIGLGDPRNFSLFVLVAGGFALTLYSIGKVLSDVSEIRKEEDDIVWIARHGRQGAPLVLAPAADREALFAQGARSIPTGANVRVETLIDDRVRRAHAARLRGGSSSVAVEELRIIADRRTARWGSFARYASSLLLLLAVLGTFAGVKTALPGLIDAVSDTSGDDLPTALTGALDPGAAGVGAGVGAVPATGAATAVVPSIAAPLRAVADAFGGNALALIGAIAIGLMAQGIGVGRRHLLERLELVSAEYVYGDEAAQSADPLRAAIQALNHTAQEIQNSSGALLGIEGGLETLGSEFKSAIRSLDDRLTQILHHQESGLYERTSSVLEELQSRVGDLASVVDANTRLYAGLVDQIGERTAESREAITQLRAANTQLTQALEGTIRLGDASASAATRVDQTSKLLVDSSIQVAQQVEAIGSAVNGLGPMFDRVHSALDSTTAGLRSINEQTVQTLAGVGEQVGRRLDQLPVAVTGAHPAAGAGREAETLLRQIAANTSPERHRGAPRWQLAALPMVGVLVGGGVLYLLAWLGVL